MIPAPDFGALEREQRGRLAATKASRDHVAVTAALTEVRRAAATTESMMPPIIAAVRLRATLGEISDALRSVWGSYRGGHG